MTDLVVMPGDSVPVSDNGPVVLGPGLRRESETSALVSKCGIFRSKKNLYWIDCHQKRYVPCRGENVVGVVTKKAGDSFRVNIGSSEPATLSYLAFEGATKKNRPDVKVGDIVYAKLLVASEDVEPELVCVDSYGCKSGLGVLSAEGYVFVVPLHTVRKLLAKNSVLISALGKSIPFEIAVGMNGRVWVRCKNARDTICIANAISIAEHMNDEEILQMASKLTETLYKF